MSYDGMGPRFLELTNDIVTLHASLIRLISAGGSDCPRFYDHLGIFPVIAFISGKCRSFSIRTRLLELAEAYPWREGLWDGKTVSNSELCSAARKSVDMD